ncbi:MAG: family 43 glycosylhydrolase [Clostridia bacterium]|nr:family 43 glycosylhydrolase [Clostridia bacterium]
MKRLKKLTGQLVPVVLLLSILIAATACHNTVPEPTPDTEPNETTELTPDTEPETEPESEQGTGQETDTATEPETETTEQLPDLGDDKMYVPQLSTTWYEAQKIVGEKDSEFISDFLLIRDTQGRWHCIGIGGQDHIQDSFFHAIGDDLLEPFTYTDRVYSNGTSNLATTDWMWAPYAVYAPDGKTAYMYYHHQTKDHRAEMRMLQSVDESLDTWVPANIEGLEENCISFTGSMSRDACIFFDDAVGKYLMYYAANEGICLRSSDDLIHWSQPTVVMTAPKDYQAAESPFVIKRHGYYYLFVSGFDYGRVAVYASENHTDFGHPVNDLIGELNGHAPEIVTVDGKDYIACAAINATDGIEVYKGGQPAEHNISGVYIQELKWVPQSQAEWLNLPKPTLPGENVNQGDKELHVITAEPDYYWDFNGNLKEQISGTEAEFTATDKNTIKGVVDQALWLDGLSQYNMPLFDFNLEKNFTVSFYVLMEKPTGQYNVLLAKGDKIPGHLEVYVTPTGTISFYQNEIGIHDTAGQVADYTWHHVIFTYDGATLVGYLDGEQIYSAKVTAVPYNNHRTQLVFGCWAQTSTLSHFHFTGGIDELKVFNRVLSAEEMGVDQ